MKKLSTFLLALMMILSACSSEVETAKPRYEKLETYSEARAAAASESEESAPEESDSVSEPIQPEPSSESETSSEPEPSSEQELSSEPEQQTPESIPEQYSQSSGPVSIATTDSQIPLPDAAAAVETDNPSTTNWQAATPTGYAADFDTTLTNLRAQYGLGPLKYFSELNTVAFTRLTEISVVFSHTRPDGRECNTVMDDFGLQYVGYGENLARGAESVYAAYDLWFSSEQHLANMIRPNFTGYCIVTGVVGGEQYWVVIFVI